MFDIKHNSNFYYQRPYIPPKKLREKYINAYEYILKNSDDIFVNFVKDSTWANYMIYL